MVYDLQELFRWTIDLSVIQLLEDKKLRKSDFIVRENYHIRLREGTAKELIEKIKFNMNRKAPFRCKNASYQTIILGNVRAVANFVLGKSKILAFVIPSLAITRNDTLGIQSRILTMTPQERRRLGIGKSTLWYQKKKVVHGTPILLYSKKKQRS